jgi:hypothetical protein
MTFLYFVTSLSPDIETHLELHHNALFHAVVVQSQVRSYPCLFIAFVDQLGWLFSYIMFDF